MKWYKLFGFLYSANRLEQSHRENENLISSVTFNGESQQKLTYWKETGHWCQMDGSLQQY